MRPYPLLAALVTFVTVCSCGGSAPTAPAPPATASTAPSAQEPLGQVAPVSPANGALVAAGAVAPVLTSRNIPAPAGALTFHAFEVATDPRFADIIDSSAVPQSSGEVTTHAMPSLEPLEQGRRYYWRVRAAAGELRGPQSDTFSFVVETIDGIRPLDLGEPLDGSMQPVRPAFTIPTPLTSQSIPNVTFQLEIARDPLFASLVLSEAKTQSRIASAANFNPKSALAYGTYYWRARASAPDGSSAVVSATRRFTVGDPVVNPPRTVSPDSGAILSKQRATMSVLNAAHSGNTTAVVYYFDVSRTPDFAASVFSVGKPEVSTGVTTAESSDLAPGTYYWRVQTKLQGSTIASDWTPTSSFTIAPEVLVAPVAVSPAANAFVSLQPALVVANSARSGPGGTLSYRFELAIEPSTATNTFAADQIVATAVVSESGTGETSWTVPFPLVSARNYTWRVMVFDPTSGVSAPIYTSSRFTVASPGRLYVLDVELPAGCGRPSASFYATSNDALNASTFRITTGLSGNLVLQLAEDAGALSGTIGGSATVIGETILFGSIKASPQSNVPATARGARNADGTLTGSFDGFVQFSDIYEGRGSCSGTQIRWVLRPR